MPSISATARLRDQRDALLPHLYTFYKSVDDVSTEIKMRHFVAHEFYGGFDDGHRMYVLNLAHRASEQGVALDDHAARIVRQARAEQYKEQREAESWEAERLAQRYEEERLEELELDREAFDLGYAFGRTPSVGLPSGMGTAWSAQHRAIFGYAASLARLRRVGVAYSDHSARKLTARLIARLMWPHARHGDVVAPTLAADGGLAVRLRQTDWSAL